MEVKSDIKKRIDEYISSTGKVGIKEGKRWRAAYTKEDKEIRQLFREIMEKEGLISEVDAIGNLYGKIKNINMDKPMEKIIIGSHMDTVKNGGAYDGAAGIIIGILALSQVLKLYGNPKIPVEVVALVEEEGSRYSMGYVGSRAIVHGLTEKELFAKDENGISLGDALNRFGYNPNTVNKAKRDDIKAYLEVHIEQGPVLNTNKKKIGIVEKITGLNVLEVSVKGREDHAGTTPMNLRKDALTAAANLITKIEKIATSFTEPFVATVGKINVSPGAVNVIPGKVEMVLEMRDLEQDKIDLAIEKFKTEAKKIENAKIVFNKMIQKPPVETDNKIQNIIEKACNDNNISYKFMASGAGHDAKEIARKIPSGMIFVPSKDGKSHCPEEWTNWDDIYRGVEVLLNTILLLDHKMSESI